MSDPKIIKKTCSVCGKEVPLSTQPGGSCPHCGSIFGGENFQIIDAQKKADDPEKSDRKGLLYTLGCGFGCLFIVFAIISYVLWIFHVMRLFAGLSPLILKIITIPLFTIGGLFLIIGLIRIILKRYSKGFLHALVGLCFIGITGSIVIAGFLDNLEALSNVLFALSITFLIPLMIMLGSHEEEPEKLTVNKMKQKIKYVEVIRPEGDGLCSDDDCPCSEVKIPRGEGYLYIPKSFVEFRSDCPTIMEYEIKKERMETNIQAKLFLGQGVANPILMCEQGAKRRELDLNIAAADAEFWWKTGKVPLRETPKINIFEDLKDILGRDIPIVEDIGPDTFGMKLEGKNVVKLNLSNNNLSHLPNSIKIFKSLNTLWLNNNNITDLPESMGDLTALEKLYLAQNELASLPQSFGNLKSLKYLDLSENNFLTLPDSISNLNSLKYLNLSENKINYIPKSIGNLKALEELLLEANIVKILPETIENFTSLKLLNLGENEIKDLPESIKKLKTLRTFNLKKNNIEILPALIGELKSLQELWLQGNQLKSLPASIGNLLSLKELDLSNNELKTLPASIRNLQSLKILTLKENKMITLPESIQNLSSLKYIGLTGNELKAQSEAIKALERKGVRIST
jgi:hypothetical protein